MISYSLRIDEELIISLLTEQHSVGHDSNVDKNLPK